MKMILIEFNLVKISYICLPEVKNPNLNQNETLPFSLWAVAIGLNPPSTKKLFTTQQFFCGRCAQL